MENRLRRMRAAMADSGIESFFCTDLSNVKWLTGFEGVFDDEPAHTLFVSADEAAMHTDSRYDQAACNAAEGTPWQVDASGGSRRPGSPPAPPAVRLPSRTP